MCQRADSFDYCVYTTAYCLHTKKIKKKDFREFVDNVRNWDTFDVRESSYTCYKKCINNTSMTSLTHHLSDAKLKQHTYVDKGY